MPTIDSLRHQPYYGYNHQEVIDMIRSRQMLACPAECPSRVYSLMAECWSEVPLRRPTFAEIHNRLRAWEGLASVCAPCGGGGASSTLGGGAPPPPIPAPLPPTNRSHSGNNLSAAQRRQLTWADVQSRPTHHLYSASVQPSTGSHSGSQHSSTGPSNNTASSHLSGVVVSAGSGHTNHFYHQPSGPTMYSRAAAAAAASVMSPVPSVANSASSTYGGASSASNVSSFPQYPVCYAQSILPGINAPAPPSNNLFHGSGNNGNSGWVGRFNTSNAAYSGSSDGGKICNL